MRRIYLSMIAVLMAMAMLCACVPRESCAELRERADDLMEVAKVCANVSGCSMTYQELLYIQQASKRAEACPAGRSK